jgi:tetratricopeptide (TPR) repeat protein
MPMRFISGIATVLIAGSVLCAANPAQQTTHSSKRHYREAESQPGNPDLQHAEEALSQNDYAAAEPLLIKVTQAEPANGVAWYDLGFVYSATQRPADATAAFRKSVEANPRLFEANLRLGLALAAAQDPDAAKYLRAATQLKPSVNPEDGLLRTWMALGQVLEKSDVAGAASAYREAAKLQPGSAAPHLALAELLRRSGDLAGAETEFQAAAATNPKSGEALAGLVNVYIGEHKYAQAEALLKQVIASDAGNAAAHIQLARVLAAQNHDPEAAAELEIASNLAPGNPEVLRALAGIHAGTKDWDKASAEYRELVKRAPNDAQAHFALGSVLLQQHKFDEAQAEFLAAVKLRPNDPEALSNLAVAAAENKQYVLAIQAVDARARLGGETPGTYYLRATAYDNLHDWVHAAENYRAFLATPGAKTWDDEWKARHRLEAIDPENRTEKKKK